MELKGRNATEHPRGGVSLPRRTRLVVIAAAVAGLGTLSAAVLNFLRGSAPTTIQLALILLVGVLVVATWVRPLLLYRDDGQSEAFNLDEGFFVIMALLLPLYGAILVFALAAAIAEGVRRHAPAKAAFNWGQAVTAAGVSLAVTHLLAPPTARLTAPEVGAATLGALVFCLVNTCAMGAIVASLGTRWRSVFEGMGIRLLVAGSCVAVAIVSALAISAYRWTLPLAVLPLLILRQVLAGHFQARHDHTRMLGLFNAALDANRPLVDGEPLEEILRSARTLLRCPLAVVRADPPGMAELGAEILVAGEAHWLVVSGRGHSEPFDAADKNLLKALAAVGVGALTNAQLYREGQFQRERLAAITASLGDGVCALDRSGRVTFTNPAALTMLGWDSFPGVTPNFLAGPAHAAMQSPAAIQREDAHLQRPDGTSMPVALTASPILHEGRVAGAVIVFRDISERRAAETAVRVARDQAIEASRLKSQFLANMSHEIRTPMNGVLGLSRMLLDTPVDETQRKYLLALRDCGENLMVIINDVLDFSKIEAGKLDLEEVNFDPAASLASVTNALTVPANEKGLLLRLHVDPQLHGEVSGDPVRLRQVLTNLVGNAIKFTPSGSVTVTALALDGARMRVLVTDTGIGIDPSARGAVLGAFGQADASTTRRYGGTGLGLAICCHLVGMMGGVLDFVSEPGNGSTFWFEVPLRPPNHGGETEAPDPAEHPAEPRAEPPVAASPIETPADAPRALRRILIADDAPVNLLVTSREVEQLGYEVVVTTNGQEALEAVQRGRYDAVLMDCLMPVMDGYEATRRIRELEGAVGATPIIAMTASAMVGDREECLLAGMDDYLSKPLRRDVLAATLERATRATGTGKP